MEGIGGIVGVLIGGIVCVVGAWRMYDDEGRTFLCGCLIAAGAAMVGAFFGI